MVTVDKVEETATVLKAERETGQRVCVFVCVCVCGGGADTHHLKVSVSDVTEGHADVMAGEPLIGSLPSVLPVSQATQSL